MTELISLKNVGQTSLSRLKEININSPRDLLFYLPYRYIDFSKTVNICDITIGENCTISGTISHFQNIFTRSHKNIQKATIFDDTGKIDLIWFNQPYLSKSISTGQKISVAGSVLTFQNKPTLIAPLIGQKTGRIIPLYHQSNQLKSNWFEKTINLNIETLLREVSEEIPGNVLNKYNLTDIKAALLQSHHPTKQDLLDKALLRLNLDKMLLLLAQSHLQKVNLLSQKPAHLFKINPPELPLPYKLSPTQETAWNDLKSDLLSSKPTHRLISGDVGSGKTIVALLAAHLAQFNQKLSLVLAPTQVLANQHYNFFKKILPHAPIHLLTSKKKLVNLESNAIIISTHAAFYQHKTLLRKVSLLVIDEQHKFGVLQRNFLANVKNPPHTISMTATPIPRTLALSLYGHLDISHLDHLDHWKPVKTYIVPENKVNNCYQWLDQHIKQGNQAFIVCPIIEDSESLTDVKSATSEFTKLKTIFPTLNLELIHSKVSASTREKIFEDFKNQKIDILVTTPLIEVGVDFPNATTIIVQSAERFGLASLHQLRGRVGRGEKPGYCYLFTNKTDSERLRYLSTHYEGQHLAEFDLNLRGPGQLFSTLQHGHFYLDEEIISLGQQIINDLSKTNFDFTKLSNGEANQNITN